MIKNKTKNISRLKRLVSKPKKRNKKLLTATGWERKRHEEVKKNNLSYK